MQTELANYYSNSVIGGVEKHREFSAIVKNNFIRRNAANYPAAIALIVGTNTLILRSKAFDLQSNIQQLPQEFSKTFSKSFTSNDLKEKTIKSEEQYSQEECKKYIISAEKRWLTINTDLKFDDQREISELVSYFISKKRLIPIPSEFDETNYLLKNKDVANAVKIKIFQSGYHHFILHGINENRKRELKI